MADTLSKADRSARLSLIRGINTRPELMLRKRLHAMGYRYRVNVSRLPGRRDLVFPMYRTIVFVHGCFWHHHANCKVANLPKSNTAFWIEKFRKNALRDKSNSRKLKRLGWRVLVVWECNLNSRMKLDRANEKIAKQISRGATLD